MDKKALAETAHSRLGKLYPNPAPLLHYKNPFELLVAVILSAQCTDEMVNKVSVRLFEHWPDPDSMSNASISDLETVVRPSGFYHTKSRHLVETSRLLVSNFKGMVPSGMDELTSLPGVGRKTANVVRSAAFHFPGIIVDTHFMRVTRRLGLTKAEAPDAIERDIMELLPETIWTQFSHELNRHGRNTCKSRKPACGICHISDICISVIK